ncbi:MAG: hypothetical protein KDD89_01775 [Anaerolineales bacterium]|nr:hypothetical protein [Anaerolineales bacterium]
MILALIWQGQAEGEDFNNVPDVLADKLRDYLMGKREPLVFYEVAVRQVADWLATGPEGWGELLGRPVPDVVASFFKTVSISI